MHHGAVCSACWRDIRFIERPYCEMLGIPFGIDLGPGTLSAEAIANPPAFDRARSVVIHSGPARALVHGLKYKDRTDLATMMGDWMVRAGASILAEADAIVPVPLHRRRLFFRQYNQAGEIARAMSKRTGLPLLASALERKKATKRQVGLTRTGRQDNLSGAFVVTEAGQSAVFGRHIVLVDDVLTTGATANAACRVLRRAGAREISVLTFAMALPDII